jgi:hypothetical protein
MSVAPRAEAATSPVYSRTSGPPRYSLSSSGIRSWIVTTIGSDARNGGAQYGT